MTSQNISSFFNYKQFYELHSKRILKIEYNKKVFQFLELKIFLEV
jgi:hypothetical protein